MLKSSARQPQQHCRSLVTQVAAVHLVYDETAGPCLKSTVPSLAICTPSKRSSTSSRWSWAAAGAVGATEDTSRPRWEASMPR